MKQNLLLLLAITILFKVNAQTNAINQTDFIEKKWIKNQNNDMILYAVNDTVKIEIGKIKNTINVENGIVIQTMVMQNKVFKTDFVDITAYKVNNLMPIYHSSNNDQRLITIAYGDTINAIYRSNKDKTFKTYYNSMGKSIRYFDSSVYQTILRWFPLKENFKGEFTIFNFDPNSETGLMKFTITSVTTEKITTKKSGIREVWKVTEKYGNTELLTSHYIDKADRKLWKQEINGGKIIMLLEE